MGRFRSLGLPGEIRDPSRRLGTLDTADPPELKKGGGETPAPRRRRQRSRKPRVGPASTASGDIAPGFPRVHTMRDDARRPPRACDARVARRRAPSSPPPFLPIACKSFPATQTLTPAPLPPSIHSRLRRKTPRPASPPSAPSPASASPSRRRTTTSSSPPSAPPRRLPRRRANQSRCPSPTLPPSPWAPPAPPAPTAPPAAAAAAAAAADGATTSSSPPDPPPGPTTTNPKAGAGRG